MAIEPCASASSTETEALAQIARDNATLTESFLEVVNNLMALQRDCLDMIDDLHNELGLMSAELAVAKGEHTSDGLSGNAGLQADAAHALREAAAPADQAASMLTATDGSDGDASDVPRLRSA